MLLAALGQAARRLAFEIEDEPLTLAPQHLSEVEIAVLPEPHAGGSGRGEPLDPGPQLVLPGAELGEHGSRDLQRPFQLGEQSLRPALQVVPADGLRRECRIVRRRERNVQLAHSSAQLADLGK